MRTTDHVVAQPGEVVLVQLDIAADHGGEMRERIVERRLQRREGLR